MSNMALIKTKAFPLLVFISLVGTSVAIDVDIGGISDLHEEFFKINSSYGSGDVDRFDANELASVQSPTSDGMRDAGTCRTFIEYPLNSRPRYGIRIRGFLTVPGWRPS